MPRGAQARNDYGLHVPICGDVARDAFGLRMLMFDISFECYPDAVGLSGKDAFHCENAVLNVCRYVEVVGKTGGLCLFEHCMANGRGASPALRRIHPPT